jgi:hypothetical protein
VEEEEEEEKWVVPILVVVGMDWKMLSSIA